VKEKTKRILSKAASDTSTEEKIKVAAKKIFLKKGYAATRTRDIAEEAGLNLALLNYYFRSKEKLFDIIMLENLQHFIEGIREILNDKETTIEQKIESIVSNYINLLIQQPDLPLFVLHELRSNPKELVSKIDREKFINKSFFMQQVKEGIKEGKLAPINPLHFLMNLVGLTIFPFVASPILQNIGGLRQQDFNALMEERKKLIPAWIKVMMKKNK
jgi:AcrR family transcriptional regulator